MYRWILILGMISVSSSLIAQDSVSDTNAVDVSRSFYPADELISFARSLIGVPYQYGGNTPSGFDCSGFVTYVFSNFGIKLPRSSPELAEIGREIPFDERKQGDIILFAGSNKLNRPVGHAGIVVSGTDEPLEFIHSATSNKQGIVVTSFDSFDYYKTRFVKIIRVSGLLTTNFR